MDDELDEDELDGTPRAELELEDDLEDDEEELELDDEELDLLDEELKDTLQRSTSRLP